MILKSIIFDIQLRYRIPFIISLLFLCFHNGYCQNRINIHIPTALEETDYVWRTIQDIHFFEKNNYVIQLPEGSLIDQLKFRAKTGNLSSSDYEELKLFVRDSIYKESDYQNGYNKIKTRLTLILAMIDEVTHSDFGWNFKEFDKYDIHLTLYGPGGSYNPDNGSILIFTTPQGEFKNYEDPANTIIHEIVHIGIEESIITEYNVPHPLKERLVDTFVFLYFAEDLPDYKIQDMGETRSDPYLRSKNNLKELDEIVSRILND